MGLAVLGSLGISAVTASWRGALGALPVGIRTGPPCLVQLVAGGQGQAVAAAVGPQAETPAFDAFMSGYRTALCAAGLSLLAAALIAWAGLRAPRSNAVRA